LGRGRDETIFRTEVNILKAQRKIVVMPGTVGNFCFNVLNETTKSDNVDKLIWGIDPNEPYNFERALKAVHKDYKQKFIDNSVGAIGRKSRTEFDLVLVNGNHTHETYELCGDQEDNEITSQPVIIRGTSRLLKKAVGE